MWDMNFHPDNCEVLRVGRKRQVILHDYILYDQTLQLVDTSKYLGVTISSKLSWNSHIDNITGKANSTLAFLKQHLQVNSPKIKTSAYFGLIRPLLEYAATTWDPYTKINIRKIEIVQRRAARVVVKNYNRTASVGEILDQLGWKSLQSRRKAMRLCMLYKLHYGLVTADGMPELTPMRRASWHLNSHAYKVPHSRTNYHKYSFFPRTIREWNLLPEDIVTLPSLDSFRNALFA